jgi:hypothetical protein
MCSVTASDIGAVSKRRSGMMAYDNSPKVGDRWLTEPAAPRR